MCAYRDDDVVTSHPDHVRSLFTAKPEEAPSLTGESPLRPIVGPNSVLTARRSPAHAPAQAAAAAVPRRGDRALRADDLRRRRARDRPLAGRRAARARAAHAGDHARRDHGGDLRHRGEAGARHAGARPAHGGAHARQPLDLEDRPARRAAQHRERRAGRAHEGRAVDPRPADLPGDRRAPRGRRPRRAARHPLPAPPGDDRGRRDAHRPGAARRAADARARRARDDRQLARVGVGAARPLARGARPPARERALGRRRRRGRAGDPGGDALASGDPDDRPPRQAAVAARRVRRRRPRRRCS